MGCLQKYYWLLANIWHFSTADRKVLLKCPEKITSREFFFNYIHFFICFTIREIRKERLFSNGKSQFLVPILKRYVILWNIQLYLFFHSPKSYFYVLNLDEKHINKEHLLAFNILKPWVLNQVYHQNCNARIKIHDMK